MLNSSLDINAMDMNSLSKLILSDHEILKDLDENVLCEMVNKMNPYSKVVGGNSKQVLFSFTNFKEDRMSVYKSLSLKRFLGRLIDESDDWCTDLKTKLGTEGIDAFKQHLELFKTYFLDYDKCRHSMSSSHTGGEEMPPLDFISRWQRYETLNSKDLNEVLDKNLLYKTNQ